MAKKFTIKQAKLELNESIALQFTVVLTRTEMEEGETRDQKSWDKSVRRFFRDQAPSAYAATVEEIADKLTDPEDRETFEDQFAIRIGGSTTKSD